APALHLACALPGVDYACELAEFDRLLDDPFEGLEPKDGMLRLPEGAGAGVRLVAPVQKERLAKTAESWMRLAVSLNYRAEARLDRFVTRERTYHAHPNLVVPVKGLRMPAHRPFHAHEAGVRKPPRKESGH